MYLVELQQGDRRHTVGLFREKKEAKKWIEALPYVHKEWIGNTLLDRFYKVLHFILFRRQII